MSIKDILLNGGGVLLLLLTIIQIAPIKINPWSALAKAIGRAVNADVLKELEEVKEAQKATDNKLTAHVKKDDERDADRHRKNILDFNNELVRDIPHDQEQFIDIMGEIDLYERYCSEHPEYQNNRAVHAVANINRVYDIRLRKQDFTSQPTRQSEERND